MRYVALFSGTQAGAILIAINILYFIVANVLPLQYRSLSCLQV